MTSTVVEKIRSYELPKKPIWSKPGRLVLLLVIFAILLATAIALFREAGEGEATGLLWLFATKTIPSDAEPLGDIALVLAPLMALALAIERLIETVFDLLEESLSEVANLGSVTQQGLKNLEDGLAQAWKAFDEATYRPESDPDKLKLLGAAHERIKKANERLAGITADPKYISSKRALSILLGLALGLIVAITSDEGIFQLLRMPVPRILDMLVTGFVIGAGSGPMHSLVGILQGVKDSIANIGGLADLKNVKGKLKEAGIDV